MKISVAILFLLVLNLSFEALASEPSILCQSGTKIQAEANTDKKMMKTYTSEFWRLLESRATKFPEGLKKKGIVVGDFHFANLGIYFDSQLDRARFTLNDLDDAGNNYLIGDLLKYMIYVDTLKRPLDYSEVVDAYRKGLNGEGMEIPFELKALLAMKAYKFDEEKARNASKRRAEAEQFDTSALTTEQRKQFEEFEKFPVFQNLTAIRRWLQINTSGSSAGMSRYVFVATSRISQVEGILEFKELRCSATGGKDRQNLQAIFNEVSSYFNKINRSEDRNSFLNRQRVVFQNGKFYLFREKSPNYMKDLDIESYSGKKAQEYANYFAYYLGFVHSGSADSSYKEALVTNKNLILAEIKPLFHQFKARLSHGR